MRTPGIYFLLAAAATLASARGPSIPEYAAKVALVDKLCRFVDWPASPQKAEGPSPFILAVVGQSPFGDELDAYFLTHTIKGRRVAVKYFRGPKDLGPCDLLYISSSERARLKEILRLVAGRPTLTIGDVAGFSEEGVILNILKEENHLAFEVNTAAAKAVGLKVASSLLQVAKAR